MSTGYPRLLGDIGGTNARWAWQAAAGAPIEPVRIRSVADDATIAESATHFLRETGLPAPAAVCIGLATPVTGDRVKLTNSHWDFSVRELQRALGAQRCLAINDFTALAMSLPALVPDELRAVGGGTAVAGAPLALLGPGTGLGVSGLVSAGGRWVALAGEGGHVTLAAGDDEEAAVLAAMRRRFGHVSAERAISGMGLENLHLALAEVHGRPAAALSAAEIGRAAAAGDAAVRDTVRLFTSLLGSVAGNLVLSLGARGGVYIGGGIVPKLGDAFDPALFRQRFEAKGRFAGYLQAVPAWIITAATPALTGAARALDEMPA